MNGAQALIESLKRENVEHMFGYAGATICPAVDALKEHPEIAYTLVRTEKAAEPEPERTKPSAAKASFEEEDGMIDFTSALSDEMEDTTSFAVASAQNAPAPREPAPAASRQRAYSPFGANSIESKFGPLKFGEGFDVERDSDPRTGLFSRKKHRDR